jgi:1-hydroxycarotenoid 3,4-desaturase
VVRAIEKLAIDRGVEFIYGHRVIEIQKSNFLVNKVCLDDGTSHEADAVIFNGDPRALATGLLGDDLRNIADKTRGANRSLSANVWGFESNIINKNLVHHNVFFSDKVNSEFYEIEKGQIPLDPTLYICAQDREEPNKAQKTERFEIILNAPPLAKRKPNKEDFEICKSVTLERFKNFGLNFQVDLERRNLTTPKDFNKLFPATEGSLYGQSPHGMMATFQRPKSVTSVANLFLVGGGIHPGAGVPMATLSALLAVEEMKASQILM